MESDLEIGNTHIRIFSLNNYPGKPVIIFLHESLGCIELWKNFPVKLAKAAECNVLVYDRQGYGKSDPFNNVKRNKNYLETEADFLKLLIDKLGIKNTVLFGHSDGGTIALLTAAEYPEIISAVITEGAHVFVEEITLNGIRQAVENYRNSNLNEKLAKYHGDKSEAVFNEWTDIWLSDEFRDWNIEKYLSKIKCPALIIQGEEDEYGSLKQVDAVINQSSGITYKLIVADSGHSPHIDAEELVIKKCSEFIKNLI